MTPPPGRRRRPWPGASVLVLAAGLVAPGLRDARAQVSQAAAAERARAAEQAARQADADRQGVRLGPYRLDASVEAAIGVDSNPVPNAPVRGGSAFVEQALRLDARSLSGRHELSAGALLAARQYTDRPELNTLRHGANLGGRLDIGARSAIGLQLRRERDALDPFELDVQQQGVAEPIPFDTSAARLTGRTRFNRLSIDGALDWRNIRYGEADDTQGRRRGFAANDYDLLGAELGAAYEFMPERSLTARLRLGEISYRDPASRGRDSVTVEALLGAVHDITPLVAARYGIGYIERRYDSPAFETLSGFAFEADLSYMPTRLLTLRLGARRSVEESIRSDSAGYIRTTARLAATYAVRANIILDGEVRAETRDYGESGGTGTDGLAQVEARWLLNRHATLVATWRYAERFEAPQTLPEYERTLGLLRLRLAF